MGEKILDTYKGGLVKLLTEGYVVIRGIDGHVLDEDEVKRLIIDPESENEDERIRKRLVEYFNGFYDRFSSGNDVNVHWEGLEVKAVIAYLEKQGQKVDIEKLRKDIYQSGYNDGYQHGKEDAQKEQKPAEWSKEYLERAIVNWLYDNDYRGWDKYGNIYVSLRNLVKLVKHFATPPHWKPSEEQMEWLESAVRLSIGKPRIHGIVISLYEQLKRL